MDFVIVAEGLEVLKLRDVAAGGRRFPLGNLSFVKRTLVGWMDVWGLNSERVESH
jgi:hypothetical protein